MTKTENKWHKTYVEGNYISTDGKWKAELRPAGYYADLGCKLSRHYAIRLRGHDTIQGYYSTLKDAKTRILDSF